MCAARKYQEKIMRKFFVLEYTLPGGLKVYFTDDFGVFSLTSDLESATQWDQGDDALAHKKSLAQNAEIEMLEVLAQMKVVPFGFN